MLIMLLIAQLNPGFLTVRADQDSLPVYVDNDFVGRTPLVHFPLKPDEYSIGFFPQDSIEDASWRFKSGQLGALWKIARYGEGMVEVRIAPDSVTEVTLDYQRVKRAPGRAKCLFSGVVGGIFALGVIVALAVQKIF